MGCFGSSLGEETEVYCLGQLDLTWLVKLRHCEQQIVSAEGAACTGRPGGEECASKKKKKERKREKKEHPSSQEKRQVVLCFGLSLSFSVSHSLTLFFSPSCSAVSHSPAFSLSSFSSLAWQRAMASGHEQRREGRGERFQQEASIVLKHTTSLAASHSWVRYHQTKTVKTDPSGNEWMASE